MDGCRTHSDTMHTTLQRPRQSTQRLSWLAIHIIEPGINKAGYETRLKIDLHKIPAAYAPPQDRKRRPDRVEIRKDRRSPTQPAKALFGFTRTGANTVQRLSEASAEAQESGLQGDTHGLE